MSKFALSVILFLSVAGGTRGADLTFAHTERSLRPGEMVLFESRSPVLLTKLHLRAFGHEFPAFSDDGGLKWTALVGVDLETKPGRYNVELLGTDKDGAAITATGMLNITGRAFPTRRLQVEEKFVAPSPDVLARIEKERARVNEIFGTINPERLWKGRFSRPVPGAVISSFGKRSIYNGKPRSPHAGVDFRGATGTPVRAPNGGVVALAANLYYTGNTVIIDHGLGLFSYLGHMSSISVKEGERVKPGDLVGKVGATGVVTGPHLHWTVRLVSTRVDPLSLLALIQ